MRLFFPLILALAVVLTGCVLDDPDFKVNSKDDILASRKHVIVTPEPTEIHKAKK